MKIFSTKHALSKGIVGHEVTIANFCDRGMVIIRSKSGYDDALREAE